MPSNSSNWKVLRLILPIMALAVLAFAAMAHWFGKFNTPLDDQAVRVLWIILGVLGISLLPIAFVLRPQIRSGVKRRFDAGVSEQAGASLLGAGFFSMTLIPAAMAEAFGMFGAIILFLTGDTRAVVAPILAAAAIFALLPTDARYGSYVNSVTGRWPTS
ncbi:MAG: hypothetical protein HZB38_03255 [Planctomycetes bacterium]|nr:hypothetical protein [Planctomycetota bacterium]